MKQPLILRQGDVLLLEVQTIPSAKDITPIDRMVLAYGEVTGHAHAIKVKRRQAKLWDAGAERFLQVMESTMLRHEEHASIRVPPGNYLVLTQKEYEPGAMRNVAD